MKQIMMLILSVVTISCHSQETDNAKYIIKDTSNSVTFIAKFDIKNATKDGYYINDYIVEINYKDAKKLDCKKIKITGKVYILKGLNSMPKEYDKDGKVIINQGRDGDTKHISHPIIEIIDN